MKTKFISYLFILFTTLTFIQKTHADNDGVQSYKPIGVGGGGALSGVSISPYADLWFVGTDMRTLFRSIDNGKSWMPVNHKQALFGSDLTKAASVGFSSDGKTVFHSYDGRNPRRSTDKGITFNNMKMPLLKNENIKYWQEDSSSKIIFCGTNLGLLRSNDNGLNWLRVKNISSPSINTIFDHGNKKVIYHATSKAIYKSVDDGKTFKRYFIPSTSIRQFTGGRDSTGLTLAYGDSNGRAACKWALNFKKEWGLAKINENQKYCGYVWISINGSKFYNSKMTVGDHLKMSENDASTIYVTGSRKWIRQYGTKIHISRDKGASWTLKLFQINWDVTPYEPWPQDKIEYSAVALDVGWWDDGYESFEVHKRNSSIAAGAGYFFLHSTFNHGDFWNAPFTEFAESNIPASGKSWRTRGLEVITVYRPEFHPRNSSLLYAAAADIGGMISEDGGDTFRISKAQYNSNYDYAFDTNDDRIVFAASGNTHDFPNSWYANAMEGNGGIYFSDNRGASWERLTPENKDLNKQFLSVAYNSTHKIIYGGMQEGGIITSTDYGKSWKYINDGLPNGSKIIPQLEIDENTGDVYALVTGNAPQFTNQPYTGIYRLSRKSGARWTLLRKAVHSPSEIKGKFWYYPTRFALDLKNSTLWLVDYENNGNWLQTGVWKTTDMGNNWYRMTQFTHPTDIVIDPIDKNKVHVAGYYDLNGTWGIGGQIYTTDGGKTWKKNEMPPLQHNSRGVTLNPDNSSEIIYSYFGGGMLIGPNPAN